MFNIDNTYFITFVIIAALLLLVIWLYKKVAPALHWLYKINKNYKYFQMATGIGRIQALIKMGKFVYNQSQLDYKNQKLEQDNNALLAKIDELEHENYHLRKKFSTRCPRHHHQARRR